MSHPHFGLRVTLALLLLGGLVAGRGLAQGEAKTGGEKAAGDKDKAAGEKADLAKVLQELKELRQKVQDQQKELDTLRGRLKSGQVGGAPFQPGFGPVGGISGPPGMARGTVVKVDKQDKTKVTISLTKKDGIKVGQRLMAFRTKGRPGPVGSIEVTEVGDKESTGKFHGMAGRGADNAVEAGDYVMAVPTGPPGFPGGQGSFPGAFPGGAGPVKAKVSKFDKEKKLLTLTVSGEHKFTAGQMIQGMRTGERPQRFMLKVNEAKGKQVVGEVIGTSPGEGGAMREGDEVMLMLGLAAPLPVRPGAGGIPQPPPPPAAPGKDTPSEKKSSEKK